jgi:acyl-CoA dehydrogenase
MENLLVEPFRQMLDAHCTPEMVRKVEAGASPAALWQAVEVSGFADALVPECEAGAGLQLYDVLPLLLASGAYALPVPFGPTMLLRACLATVGVARPEGSIALACNVELMPGNGVRCTAVPYGTVADWVVVDLNDQTLLVNARTAKRVPTGVHGSLEADIEFDAMDPRNVSFASRPDWLAVGAALFAAQMAGAMRVVLDRTIGYANERAQFGKTIGQFQAIQQQLGVMAEEVYASHMAAEMAYASPGAIPDTVLAAVAKSRVSEAAYGVASIAHAVHGAIGITEEYDLQLHTRRLHEWRLAYGSESYWNQHLGTALLDSGQSALDFMRSDIFLWDCPQTLVPG